MRFAAKFVRLAILSLALLPPFPAGAHNEEDIVRVHQDCRVKLERHCPGQGAKECRSARFAECLEGEDCWTEKRRQCWNNGSRCRNEIVTVCKGRMPCEHDIRQAHKSSAIAQLHAQCMKSAKAVCRHDGRRAGKCANWEFGLCLKRNDLCVQGESGQKRKTKRRQTFQ